MSGEDEPAPDGRPSLVLGPAVRGRCCGLELDCRFTLATRLLPARAATDLTVTLGPPGPADDHRNSEPLYASPVLLADGEPRLSLFRRDCEVLFRLGDDLEFALGEKTVDCRPRGPDRRWMVEPVLLTTVLALYLEGRGVVALHGSAVEIEGQAVGFLATSTGGKSTLAARWVAAGHPLLTDDVLAVEEAPEGFRVRPSYPLIKLDAASAQLFPDAGFPGLVEFFPGAAKRAVAVGPGGVGSFAAEPRPLAALYLLERREGAPAVSISPVSPRDGVVAAIRQSFAPRLVEALGLAPRRLDFLARLAGAVPIRRLLYPSGFGFLPAVAAVVARDLERRCDDDLCHSFSK